MKRNRWFNYLIGGALGLLLTLLLTQAIWPLVSQLIYKNDDILYFIGINLTFFPIIISIILILRFYHRSNLTYLINPTGKINYKRIIMGFTIWFILQTISFIFSLIFNIDTYTFNFSLKKFSIFLLLSLILTPIQISSEEFLFRGYLINGLNTLKLKGILFPLITSALLFALPHMGNPEVQNNKLLFFFIYLSMALLFSYITLKYKGLEYSLGVHYANNFFAINLVNYPKSPLPSSPLFIMNSDVEPVASLLQTIIFGAILITIIKKIEKRVTK